MVSQRRLRQLARPRPELPAARQPAHPGQPVEPAARLRRSSRRSTRTPTRNRPTVSRGESEYNALIFALRRRLSHGVDFSANYTLQKGISTIGTAADELNTANIQDPNNPFDDPRQFGPNLTTDARHLINLSATFQLPCGIRIAPIFLFRSALPVNLIDGRDLNLDGDARRHPGQGVRGRLVRSERRRLGSPDDVQGARQLRDGELRPRHVADADEPARLEGVQPRRPRARRGDRRDLQPVQRHQPERLPGARQHPDDRRRRIRRCSNRPPSPATSVVRNSASASSDFGSRSNGGAVLRTA